MPGLKKRSLRLHGHFTSVALEEPFWDVLVRMAEKRRMPLGTLISDIDAGRGDQLLASSCRLAALAFEISNSGTAAKKKRTA